MFRRENKNQAVDAIGRKLVENDLLSVEEIDQIIGNPALFDGINRRIAAIENSVPSAKPRHVGSWVPAAAGSLLSIAIVAAVAMAVIYRNDVETARKAVPQVQFPVAVPENARPEVPPKPVVSKLSAGRAPNIDDSEIRPEKAVYRRPAATKTNFRQASAPAETETEFYPVAYTGDPAETAGGGRIIRVNLNRSSLFALGVNMPLENDDAVVRADLLIGMDGVTRAIRLVE